MNILLHNHLKRELLESSLNDIEKLISKLKILSETYECWEISLMITDIIHIKEDLESMKLRIGEENNANSLG